MKHKNIQGYTKCCGANLNGNYHHIPKGIWVSPGHKSRSIIKSNKPQAIVSHIKTKNGPLTITIVPTW